MQALYAAGLMVLSSLAATIAPANEWRTFRGPAGSSYATDVSGLPTRFDIASGENIAWQTDLPGRGVSGPVVAGGRVIVTASSGANRERLHVIAVDAASGKSLWQRKFWATGRTLCHPTSANAAPTPATDGERVFAFYSSNDLVCLNLNGDMLWYRGLALDHPGLGNDVGMSSSPVVAGDAIVVQCECQANSFAAAYNRQTGKEMWTVDRPALANWASPIAIKISVNDQPTDAVVLQSREGLAVHAANDGKLIWQKSINCSGIPSAAVQDGVLYAPGGDGLTALATSPNSPSSRTLWSEPKLICGNPSPIITPDGLLVVTRAGVLIHASTKDGSSNWKKRLGGRFWGTPVAVGHHLYAINDTGEVIVVDLREREIISRNKLGDDEEVFGSPAVADNALFIRSHRHLWKIATP